MNRLLGNSVEGSTAMSAALGGTISSLSGGDFKNGAMTAAFAHLYNDCLHGMCGTTDGDTRNPFTQRVPRYGNFTGLGHRDDLINLNPAHSGYAPIDAIDAAARQHDIDYYNNGIEWSSGTHSNYQRYVADQKLLNAVNALNQDQLSWYQKRVIQIIDNTFRGAYVP